MRYSSLAQLEADFLTTGNNGEYSFKQIAVPVKGENLTLHGLLCTPVRRTGYFHAVEHPKERILVHFTAGHVRSDLSALTRENFHVSVPFVISRDGTIYQLYSSKFWSGNIGEGLSNGGNAEDKKTIAIEISNYGFLTEKDGNLETIYSRSKSKGGHINPVDVYCSLNEREAYQKLSAPFRGESYFATFTSEQYESLIVLLRYLTAQYNIPRKFLPEDKRFLTTDTVNSFRGIVSHVNYRSSGKWDIGPAFDWARVISGVESAAFQPSMAVNRDILPGDEVIRCEDDIEGFVSADKGMEFQSTVEEMQDIDSTAVLENENETKAKKKTVYALIVGINDYREDIVLEGRVVFPKLRGCVKDAKKLINYLKEQDFFNIELKTLFNKEATKEAVVEGFQGHLGKAKNGDTILFYYSGHGTQEWADKEAWTSSGDGRLECLACYYDEGNSGRFLLADKELRYLLKQLSDTSTHIVAIFDCCHSGDNTRNGAFAQAAFGAVEKRIPFSFRQREWDDFIFGKQIQREDLIKKGEAEALPEGLHVQLSACESDESAVEVNGEGVFTKAFINTLQSARGDVTYQALRSRVRQYLRNVYEQKPRIYVVNGEETLLYSIFLNRGAGEKSLSFGDVLHNGEGWQLSLGAIHGIGESTKTITVLDIDNGNKEFEATIKTIKADISELSFPNGFVLDETKAYKGYVENLLTTAIRVCVNNVDGDAETQEALMQALSDRVNNFIKLDEREPQYAVNNCNGQLYVTKPNDVYRPVVRPLEAVAESVSVLMAYLRQIAQWEHLRNLSNKGSESNLTGNEITVTMKSVYGTETKEVPIKENTAKIDYNRTNREWKAGMEIELKNATDTPLYCAALFLTYNFGVVNNLLPGIVKYIEPGQSVNLELSGRKALSFCLNKEVEWYNWEGQLEYLKLIVNTEEFDAAILSMEALPSPFIPGQNKGLMMTRGLDTKPNAESLRGWGTQTVELQQPNPEYNNINIDNVEQMLADDDTATFALGLYFDAVVDSAFTTSYKLKREVQPIERKKGLLNDLMLNVANSIARRKRNNLFKETIKKYPGRIRIVSEGDSWFQHPLVVDIIDHLSRTYAVYCASAAGDTLRNIQSGDKTRGEYYLNAIDTAIPDFFLISGGGNDILGSQFRGYLQDKFDEAVEEGKDPERFLHKEIFKEIESLTDIYRSLFQNLKQSHPTLRVIIHGYDYPVKLDEANKGWLGRYMIEKGIMRAGDRHAIIHAIMDNFNHKLREVAMEFDNVSYLDLRGLVRFSPEEAVDQWYDEIHPNDEGFQQIAMKYIQKITEKLK